MSTITSPCPSSLGSTPTSSRTASPAPQPRARATKIALRDYYGLKQPPVLSSPTSHNNPPNNILVSSSSNVPDSELDTPSFDADAYVHSILASHGLEGVLKVESGLIGEIKSLDGERKALVYDDYSKLIAATDTIRRIRDNMGPLTPATSGLSAAVEGIAEMAGGLAMEPRKGVEGIRRVEDRRGKETEEKRQRETVRWELGAPRRLGVPVEGGKRDEAERDWSEIKVMLEKWQGVAGVEESKVECEKVMGRD